MDKTEEIRQWIHLAEEDLAIAEQSATNMYPPPVERICNLCQAVAERYLKVFLVYHDIEFKRTHDLITIQKLCESVNPDFSRLSSQTIILTDYGVLPRYPNELQIDESDMKTALQYARDVKAFVEPLIGTDAARENV
jgi:HEPN domain-containing protein